MEFFKAIATSLLAILPLPAFADTVSDKLEGTWVDTQQYADMPRTVLHFKGRELRFENMFATSATVQYTITDKKPEEFTISFEYRYKVTRANGRIVERCERPEFLYHVENGRPILSEKSFEYDGRGPILMSEYLLQKDFIDNFKSELKHKLNDRPSKSQTVMELSHK